MISFACSGCGKTFEVADAMAGRKSRCKQCGVVMRIPEIVPLVEPLAPRPVFVVTAAPSQGATKRKKKGKTRPIDRDAWVALAIGSGLALVALQVPLVGFVVHVLVTVIHELGHSATAWLFASPALPSFDLTYGGGTSHILKAQPILILAAYALLAYLSFVYRRQPRARMAVIGGAVLYTIVMLTPLRELLITAMGHGAELLIGGIFLYRALSGNQVLRREERPLYAFLGLFIILADVRFAFRLLTSPEHREEYGDAKGGGHAMDFDVIAADFFHGRLETVAGLFLLACLLTLVASFLAHRYGKRLGW